MKLSIIIPIKDEPYIQTLIDKIHDLLRKHKISYEIIVVDKSRHIEKIENARHMIQKSNELGNAILEGVKHSIGDFILTMDGDGSHRPEDLIKFVKKMDWYDIIVGSRFVKDGEVHSDPFRIIVSKIYCTIASILLDISVKDNMSGFVATKRKIYETINPNPRGFKINAEVLFKAKKFGFKSVEIPIKFLKRKGGKQKSGAMEGLRTLLYLLELKLGIR